MKHASRAKRPEGFHGRRLNFVITTKSCFSVTTSRNWDFTKQVNDKFHIFNTSHFPIKWSVPSLKAVTKSAIRNTDEVWWDGCSSLHTANMKELILSPAWLEGKQILKPQFECDLPVPRLPHVTQVRLSASLKAGNGNQLARAPCVFVCSWWRKMKDSSYSHSSHLKWVSLDTHGLFKASKIISHTHLCNSDMFGHKASMETFWEKEKQMGCDDVRALYVSPCPNMSRPFIPTDKRCH